jgi:hypothetical protein
LRRLADHHPHAVVDEEALADPHRRMDLDPSHRARDRRDRARKDRHTGPMESVRNPVRKKRMHARPRGEYLQRADAASGRIATVGGGDVAPDLRRGAGEEPKPEHR